MQAKLFSPYKRYKAISIIPKSLMAYPGLSLAAKAVWGMLASHAGEREIAYPSQETLARECSLSRRCVQRALDELEEKQFIACLGLRHRNKVWGFLEHPVLGDSASECRTSTNESASDLRTTPEDTPETPVSVSKCVKMTQDSASDLRMIVRQNDASYMKGFSEEVHGKGSSLPSAVGGTCDSPAEPPSAGSSDPPKNPNPIFDLYNDMTFGMLKDFVDYQELEALEEEYGADAVLAALHTTARAKIRRRGVLPYVNKVLKESQQQKEVSGYAEYRGSDSYGL